MAEIHSLILTAMDRLWFHRIILLSEPISIICSKSIVSSPISSESSTSSSDHSQLEEDKEASANLTTISVSQDDCSNEVLEKEEGEEAINEVIERAKTRNRNHIIKKSKSQPTSRPCHRPCRSLNYVDDIQKCLKLPRTLSCRSSSCDLEQLEVQGFMDLGFQFEKDQLTPRTMSMIPGLQRVLGSGGHECKFKFDGCRPPPFEGKEGEKKEEKRGALRPYLYEAWEVKKPNSPLLRLRMARVNTSEDMKKCLKLWAKTVASSVQLD